MGIEPTSEAWVGGPMFLGRSSLGRYSEKLHTIQGECPLGASKIKMVGAQNLQVAQLVPHAQLVVCLKLVTVAGPANALKVFAAVWIPWQ